MEGWILAAIAAAAAFGWLGLALVGGTLAVLRTAEWLDRRDEWRQFQWELEEDRWWAMALADDDDDQ